MFSNPFYIEKNLVTGTWSNEIPILSIKMEVGGGWNIDTGQWSVSPNGRYLAVADATENSIHYCGGGPGDTPRVHNAIKIFDMETLKTTTITVKNSDENFTLNSWEPDGSGIYATKYKMIIDSTEGCNESVGESTQEFYSR